MNPVQILTQTLAAFGWQGIMMSLVILILVYIARKSGVVATGDHARIANIVLSAILFGLTDSPTSEKALMSAIASMLAGLAYEGLKYISNRVIEP